MAIGNLSKENEIKNLIIRAWRERWTDCQWGIHIRAVLEDDDVHVSFISDAILGQALNGPGPNNLVLSYLKHSVFSHIISTTAVLKSISQYTNFYKPFCLESLLGLLEEIKDRVIRSDEGGDFLDLSLSLQSIIYWLLSVMYSSLEKISDMTDLSELSGEVEDSKIVTNCRKLLEFFLADPFIKALLVVASLEAPKVHESIQKMCRETLKFGDGVHSSDITSTLALVEGMRIGATVKRESDGGEESASSSLFTSLDGKCLTGVNGAIQTTVMIAALLRTTNEVELVANDLVIIKQLKDLTGVELYADVIHSGMIGLADAIGKDSELKFIGFTFLQLPVLLRKIRDRIHGTEGAEELSKGLDSFLLNESALDVIDSKLHCSSWDLFLLSLHKNGLLDDEQKEGFLAKRSPSTFAQKKNSSNAVIMLKAEMTVLNVLKILDGDYLTQQDKIFTVISSMLGETFEMFLIAASSTGLLQQVTARLLKLNQLSKQVNGESSKASTTRAVIFDSSFLALCHIMQTYGPEYLPDDEGDCFFGDWYRASMGVEGEPKNPQGILAACDGKKVDLLLNQYLNSTELDLKTSLVLWHELCLNAVGVISELLLAWGKDAVNFAEVKKVLDILRSKICALPVCIASWLCSFIHVMPEEECGKARYILDHLMSPSSSLPTSEEGQDNFKDRRRLMAKIITNMIQSTIHSTVPGSQSTPAPLSLTSIHESTESQALFDSSWTKRGNRGIMDVGTTLQMKNLLRISGPVHFVTLTAQRLFEIQHKVELGQWRDLAYGILHLDGLDRTIPAFLTHLLPKILHQHRSEMNCVEPQGIALVSLAVDLTLSFYLHTLGEHEEGAEPPRKRRKMARALPPGEESVDGRLDGILRGLFAHFHQILSRGNERSPSVRLIFRFLKEIALKTPSASILHGLSGETVSCLISIMGDQLSPNLLLSFFPVKETEGRRNCAKAIARLKILQDEIGTHIP